MKERQTWVVVTSDISGAVFMASSVFPSPLEPTQEDGTIQFSSVQSLSHVWCFATPWIAACQASLYITNSQSLLKLMSIESVVPSSHLILCRPLLLLPTIPPSIRVFSNKSTLPWASWSIGVSALASVLLMNTQDWSPLEWTGWISLQSKGLARVFSNTRQHIKKQRHYFPNKGPYSQGYGFSSGHVWMWKLDCEESWAEELMLLKCGVEDSWESLGLQRDVTSPF